MCVLWVDRFHCVVYSLDMPLQEMEVFSSYLRLNLNLPYFCSHIYFSLEKQLSFTFLLVKVHHVFKITQKVRFSDWPFFS